MKCVSLVADRDNDNPFRTLPEKDRRIKVAMALNWPMEGTRLDKNGRDFVAGKIESIEKAIAKYRELQYDEDKEIEEAYDKQIQDTIELMKADKGKDVETAMALTEKSGKLSKLLPEIKEARQKIRNMRGASDNKPEIESYTAIDLNVEDGESGVTLSSLDAVMMKQKNNND